MKIQITTAYRVGEQVFPTIQEAQRSELVALLVKGHENQKLQLLPNEAADVANCLLANSDEVVAILTCTPKERKPRADRGGTHRKPSKQATSQATMPVAKTPQTA